MKDDTKSISRQSSKTRSVCTVLATRHGSKVGAVGKVLATLWLSVTLSLSFGAERHWVTIHV